MSRLLILDDEKTVAETIALLAEYSGHQARWTADPIEFLALHRTWAPTHLAIDLVMPEIDGIDVLGLLAESGCTASIIISSGLGGRVLEAARLFATENGLRIAGVLAKPFGARDLAPLLEEHADAAPGTSAEPATVPTRAGAPQAPTATYTDLLHALDRSDGLQVAYQPKVHCADGRLAGFEALARWRHPHLGSIPPGVFISLAEHHDLIDRLTDHVLHKALSWFAAAELGDDVTLSVNISARTLTDPKFVGRLTDLCAEHDVTPDLVVLELTETSRSDDPVMSLRLLTRLRMQGFQLSLDDFGTGYSSMQQLARLPFSEVKVDRSFVGAATTSDDALTLVRSMIDLGHDLGLTTTAEGVEDQATLDLLRRIGSDLAQGFHLARPMPPDQARSWRPRA